MIHLLLMEDEPSVAQAIRLHLQGRGLSVDVAEDGTKGLEMYYAGYYDVLVIDQKMPKLPGLEVIRALKQRGPLPPILVISALGSEEVAVEALKLGAMDYVIKDAGSNFLERLPAIIDDVLKRYREAESLRHAGEERTRWLHELKERVKELGCLYGMEKLFGSEGETLEAVLQGAVNLIPHACRHESLCGARVRARELEIKTDNFRDTEWKKSFALKEAGKLVGSLDVGYREKPPVPEREMFSPEEMELLHSIAERMGHFIERWHTEQQLREIHEELRKLSRAVEQSANAILITNAKGEIEYVNPSFGEMTGYPPAEVIGQNPRFLKSGQVPPETYREMWETIAAGRQWRGEFLNRRKDGRLYWDFSTISPILSAQGAVTHFVAIKQEITERKETEALQAGVLAISAAVAGCQTEDEICREVVEGIRNRMGVDRCGLFLGNPNRPPFRGTYGTNMDGATSDEHDHLWDIGHDRDVKELFEREAYKSGFPLGRPDPGPGEEGLSATLVALRQAGEVFGVISLDNRITRRPVSRGQMVYVAMLAEVIGNALQVARARDALGQSVEEARRANEELEAFNRAMVGRENRVIELKEEVNGLLAEHGQPPRYPPVWTEPERAEGPPPGKAG